MTAPALRPARSPWQGLLRLMAYVACPAAAGAAFVVLALGIVTWLPALAAVAHTLHRWREEDDTRCFTGVFEAFRHYVRPLLAHGVVSTVVIAVLAVNAVFLTGRQGLVPWAMLAAQVGLAAVFVIHHLALAVCAGRAPTADRPQWTRDALAFGLGSPARGTALLAAAVAAPIVSLPVPLGPLLLGPTLPVLVGLAIAAHTRPS
jgi:uncharacterized membrane protein YesL